jgi:hypothetical protein
MLRAELHNFRVVAYMYGAQGRPRDAGHAREGPPKDRSGPWTSRCLAPGGAWPRGTGARWRSSLVTIPSACSSLRRIVTLPFLLDSLSFTSRQRLPRQMVNLRANFAQLVT